MSNYPAAFDDEATLLRAVNNFATTLTGSINSSNEDIPVASVTGLQAEDGVVSIDDEVILYTFLDTGGSVPVLRACTRGHDGTPAQNHSVGARVEARWVAKHHNSLFDAILAIEQTLGVDPAGDAPDLATRLQRGSPEVIAIQPAASTWQVPHDKRRIVGVQLWRKNGSAYEMFTADVQQELNPTGAAYVTVTLTEAEEGFIVLL
jgi:hypothetical protein